MNTIRKLIKQIRIAMLTTEGANGELHSRPMQSQQTDFDGDLWFFANRYSTKVDEILLHPRVNVSYLSANGYVSLAGTAHIIEDVAKKRGLWHDSMRVWFEAGPESPDVVLICIEATSGQFWDGPDGPFAKLISMVKMFALGSRAMGEGVSSIDL
jgi:general stress protein 26